MSRIPTATPYDTDEIVVLRETINAAGLEHDLFVRKSNRLEHERFGRYDRLLARQRPEYPTPEHLAGLQQVAQLVHEDLPYGDHLGNATVDDRHAGRTLPGSGKFHSATQRINVYALAPYAARTTRRLWSFTDDDTAALRDHLRGLSLRVISEWIHEDGVAFIAASQKV